MRVVELPEILKALDHDAALQAVESAFVRFHAGQSQITAVGHLAFQTPPGDCHVKGAHMNGDDVYVIKIASSFYENPARGLSSSNGFMAVISATTGEVEALLHDQGRLTDERTAMAGAIAARAIARPGSTTLGIVGAGIQAELQARYVARRLGMTTTLIWARNSDRAAALATKVGGESVDLPTLCARADVIVTTTPSTHPLLTDAMIRPGTRIVAVGADTPGKQELEAQILARAKVVVDSRQQCIDHGETASAVRAGLLDPAALMELGGLLARPVVFSPADIVVADLTGVGIQDAAIAKSVWDRLR